MIDILPLRTALETALADDLGTYTFSLDNGQTATTPAVTVDEGNSIEEPMSVTGLELVIVLSPEDQIKALLNDEFQMTHTALIVLKQWDETKTTIEALPRLLEGLAEAEDWAMQSGSLKRVRPLARLGNVETLSLTVFKAVLTEV